MQLRHIELRELLRSDNPDHDAIMRKLDEVNALQGKMEKQRVETMLTARSVLTPEQLKKIKTFMENRGGGPGRGPMERRGGMGRPPHPAGPGGAPGADYPESTPAVGYPRYGMPPVDWPLPSTGGTTILSSLSASTLGLEAKLLA